MFDENFQEQIPMNLEYLPMKYIENPIKWYKFYKNLILV